MQQLSEQAQTVDFAAYRSQLKNQDIVADVEKQFNAFQVKKVDVARQVKAIEAFEAQAVKSAEETKGKVDAELKDLEKTLKNIETARPFEDLTVVRIRMREEKLQMGAERHVIMAWLTMWNRTKSLPHARTSTSAFLNSSPRAAGKCRATRYESTVEQPISLPLLTPSTGEIRRPLCAIVWEVCGSIDQYVNMRTLQGFLLSSLVFPSLSLIYTTLKAQALHPTKDINFEHAIPHRLPSQGNLSIDHLHVHLHLIPHSTSELLEFWSPS